MVPQDPWVSGGRLVKLHYLILWGWVLSLFLSKRHVTTLCAIQASSQSRRNETWIWIGLRLARKRSSHQCVCLSLEHIRGVPGSSGGIDGSYP